MKVKTDGKKNDNFIAATAIAAMVLSSFYGPHGIMCMPDSAPNEMMEVVLGKSSPRSRLGHRRD